MRHFTREVVIMWGVAIGFVVLGLIVAVVVPRIVR
jgi:hypothetical protein